MATTISTVLANRIAAYLKDYREVLAREYDRVRDAMDNDECFQQAYPTENPDEVMRTTEVAHDLYGVEEAVNFLVVEPHRSIEVFGDCDLCGDCHKEIVNGWCGCGGTNDRPH